MTDKNSLRTCVRDAWLRSVPVMAGYIVLGIGFGIILSDKGYGVLWALAMSLLIYAGSMQYVGVSLLAGSVSLLTAAMTTVMVNARHLFYSISMVERYKKSGAKKPYLIFSLTDETYSLLCDWDIPEGDDPYTFAFLVSLFDQCYWVLGSVLGAALGSVLPFSTKGIDFSMTALFIATVVEQWITLDNHIPAITGIAGTLACLLIFGPDQFLIPSMLVITLVLTVLRGRIEAKPDAHFASASGEKRTGRHRDRSGSMPADADEEDEV